MEYEQKLNLVEPTNDNERKRGWESSHTNAYLYGYVPDYDFNVLFNKLELKETQYVTRTVTGEYRPEFEYSYYSEQFSV